MHVNHMQIVEVDDEAEQPVGRWHRVGDWVDTFMGAGVVRFHTDRYMGKAVLHCHLLEHEDEGCMAQMDIVSSLTRWGFCLNDAFEPRVAGLLCTLLPVLISGIILALKTKSAWSCGRSCCNRLGSPCGADCDTCGQQAENTCIELRKSALISGSGGTKTKAAAAAPTAICSCLILLLVGCIVTSILPMVNDGAGGIVETFHRNEDDYYTMLAISVPCFLITVGFSGVWAYKVFFDNDTSDAPAEGAGGSGREEEDGLAEGVGVRVANDTGNKSRGREVVGLVAAAPIM
ncbi:unnamed protein product [Amoebophrya sp. A25]|nr:unnamed protein product [Amoebophrya sp. A25]|eukprot:GSA25T00023072001.1